MTDYRLGDRVQEQLSGWVGTVTRTYVFNGVALIEVEWDRSTFRHDDAEIRPFDDEAEQAAIERRLRHDEN